MQAPPTDPRCQPRMKAQPCGGKKYISFCEKTLKSNVVCSIRTATFILIESLFHMNCVEQRCHVVKENGILSTIPPPGPPTRRDPVSENDSKTLRRVFTPTDVCCLTVSHFMSSWQVTLHGAVGYSLVICHWVLQCTVQNPPSPPPLTSQGVL